jgi:Protein of unknown function (DUF3237)
MAGNDKSDITRRGLTAAAIAAAAAPAAAQTTFTIPQTGLQFAFTAKIKVDPTVEFKGVEGVRRHIPITGGSIEGPRLTGAVLGGGADWQRIRANGITDLVARYAFRATDGTVIGVVNSGIRRAPPAILARLRAGEILDPSLYYFRAAPVFDVGPGPHEWLTESLFVSVGARYPDEVRLAFYQVL